MQAIQLQEQMRRAFPKLKGQGREMKASNPPGCSVHGLHVLKPGSFSPNRTPKMRERHQLAFGLRLESEELHHSCVACIRLY